LIISIILGIQLNVAVEDLQAGDDFIAELLVIRNKKINKKKARLFEQMALSNVTKRYNNNFKEDFISKQNNRAKSTINKTAGSEGNICRFQHMFTSHQEYLLIINIERI
jgi:hypothetical protein